MDKDTILTIGYEGAALADFVATLLRAGIDHVIDIRELPISRRPGFSKTALSEALSGRGIKYSHIRQLGDPKEGREAARKGDYVQFRKIYARHLRSEEAQKGLSFVMSAISESSSCLLCYERDPANCHRSMVAAAIAERVSVVVRHLGVQPLGNRGSADNERKDRRSAFR